MKPKIFLGNAPWLKPGYYGVRAGSRWPHFQPDDSLYMPFPFFLAYTSALLKREGFPVCLVDGIAERISADEFMERLQTYSPALVVFEVSTMSIDRDLEYAARARKLLGSETLIIFCGLHAEMKKGEFLETNRDIDIVMVGEYEYTLLDVARAWSEDGDLEGVQGILFRDKTGEIRINEPREVIKDLDALPWPDRDGVVMDNYCDTPWKIPMPSVQMWASRGCPFQCVFCAWPQIMYGNNMYRVRDPEDVAREMAYLVNERGFKSVYFDDDTFNIGKKRILALCDEIKKRDLTVPWAVMARADTMDREMLVALKDAGLVALKYGVESADQSLVEASGKGLDLDKVKNVIAWTKELGIKVHLTYTFGLPGETHETIEKTIQLSLEHDPDSVQFSIITPFPGSTLYHDLDGKGHIISKNWSEYDGNNKAVIKTDTLSSTDLEQALQRALKVWGKHTFKKQLLHEPWRFLALVVKHPRTAFERLRWLAGLRD